MHFMFFSCKVGANFLQEATSQHLHLMSKVLTPALRLLGNTLAPSTTFFLNMVKFIAVLASRPDDNSVFRDQKRSESGKI